MQGRRVAVTGIGADAFWQGLLEPAPEGSRAIDDFDPEPYFDNVKESRRTDRCGKEAQAQVARKRCTRRRTVRRGPRPC